MSSERLRVRVVLGEDGRTAIREMMRDGEKICDVSYIDVIDLISDAIDFLRGGLRGTHDVVLRGVKIAGGLSFVDVIEFMLQASSSLRWELPTKR